MRFMRKKMRRMRMKMRRMRMGMVAYSCGSFIEDKSGLMILSSLSFLFIIVNLVINLKPDVATRLVHFELFNR